MKKPSIKTRAVRAGGYSITASAIVLVIVIIINLLMNALPSNLTQIDTSSNQLYTLSEQTENILVSLDTDVDVYWIVRSGSEDDTLELLLNKYAGKSSHISLTKVDPDIEPAFVANYTDSVSDNSLIVVSENRSTVVDYDDIYTTEYVVDETAYYGYSTETTFNGESAITSALDYVMEDNIPVVYNLTGHSESDLSSDFSKAVSGQNIEIEDLNLLETEEIPEDAAAILINNPQSDISSEEREIIEEYLADGGKILLISAPLTDEDTTLTNLNAMLYSGYGVSSVDGIVIEGDSSYYAWGTPYYLLPTIASHSTTSSIKSNGYYILLAIAQGIEISDSLPDNVTVKSLLTTSDDAFSKVDGYNMTSYEKESGDIDGGFSLAVAISDSSSGAGIIWIGSSYVVDDSANEMVSGANEDFFLNCLNYLCDKDETSLSIHSKSMSLDYLTITSSDVTKYAVIFIAVIPLIFLAAGVVVFVRRRRK